MKLRFPKFDQALVEGIESYLDMHYQTEVTATSAQVEGVVYTFARGLTQERFVPGVRQPGNYSRPMFQVMPAEAFSGGLRSFARQCQCYRLERSWNCPEHPERKWDHERRKWITDGEEEPVSRNHEGAFMDVWIRAFDQAEERASYLSSLTPFTLSLDGHFTSAGTGALIIDTEEGPRHVALETEAEGDRDGRHA